MKVVNLFQLLIIVAFINSCDENNPINPFGSTSQIYSISGKIEGWHLGSDKEVILLGNESATEVFAKSKIDSEGNFNLLKLSAPTEILYNTVNPQFSNEGIINNTINCSDSSAKKILGYLCIVMAGDTTNNIIGRIYEGKFSDTTIINENSFNTGDFNINYVYADKDVNVSGEIETHYTDTYQNKEYHYYVDYNLCYKKGWNKEVRIMKSKEILSDSLHLKINSEVSYSNSEPNGSYWIYHDGH